MSPRETHQKDDLLRGCSLDIVADLSLDARGPERQRDQRRPASEVRFSYAQVPIVQSERSIACGPTPGVGVAKCELLRDRCPGPYGLTRCR